VCFRVDGLALGNALIRITQLHVSADLKGSHSGRFGCEPGMSTTEEQCLSQVARSRHDRRRSTGKMGQGQGTGGCVDHCPQENEVAIRAEENRGCIEGAMGEIEGCEEKVILLLKANGMPVAFTRKHDMRGLSNLRVSTAKVVQTPGLEPSRFALAHALAHPDVILRKDFPKQT